MLVLSRKKGEKIVLYDNIFVEVIEIRGDKVRLGVEAPKEVSVHRNEVYEMIKREKVIEERIVNQSTKKIDQEIENVDPKINRKGLLSKLQDAYSKVSKIFNYSSEGNKDYQNKDKSYKSSREISDKLNEGEEK